MMLDGVDLSPYGMQNENLVEVQNGYLVDSSIVPFLNKLTESAKNSGFELRIESAYRPFEKQLSIWNRKARGELPLLSATGEPMEVPKDEKELTYAILTWSALPGASRHHLGTDIDVVDGASCPEGYEVELTPAECSGMFAKFHQFLSNAIEKDESFGFNRVFVSGRGKIRPEQWHIAHLPTSRKKLEKFSLDVLRRIYEQSDMACKKFVLANLEKLAEDYIYPYFV
ncbi:M15 family metallopeptidase [Fibrobacter sp.]|uniref:M15 family metallopeptidase n=1 Tax=Fibrobacter sp. TaxID=35828 RepID=UPI00388FB5A9